MESQPQNLEFMNNSENFHPCIIPSYQLIMKSIKVLIIRVILVWFNSLRPSQQIMSFHLTTHFLGNLN